MPGSRDLLHTEGKSQCVVLKVDGRHLQVLERRRR